MWSHHEEISTGRAHETRFESSFDLDSQISKEGPDGGNSDPCARPSSTNCYGTRTYDSLGKSGLRPHSRLDSLSTACGCEYDRTVAQRDLVPNTSSGVCAPSENVLGETFMGERIFGFDDRDVDGRNGSGVHSRTGRGAGD